MDILSTSGLSKHYPTALALNKVSIAVPQGSIFGLLGPNGSGKTTFLATILNLVMPTAGSFQWILEPEDLIGATLEQPNFYPHLTGYDNLKITSLIKRVPLDQINDVLTLVKLLDRADEKFSGYSLGMKQRLAIAGALLGNPKVLLLDEPTNGLDAAGIAFIRELILEVNSRGITVILASHLLDEVEKVCTHLAILEKGNIKFQGSVQQFLNPNGAADKVNIVLAHDDLDLLSDTVLELYPSANCVKSNDHHLLVTLPVEVTTSSLNASLAQQGIYVSHLSLGKTSFTDQFFSYTKAKG